MDVLQLSPEWERWLQDEIGKGRSKHELATALGDQGYRNPHLLKYLNEIPKTPWTGINHTELCYPRLTKLEHYRYPSDLLQLYLIPYFMTEAECQAIIELSQATLRPSTLSSPSPDPEYRTSRTCDLCYVSNPLVQALDQRIAATLGFPVTHAEGTQLQYYLPRQQFKQHNDYFHPGTQDYQVFAGQRGQRVWTFMIYLNEVASGGATRFYAINYDVHAVTGMAVVWNNILPNGLVNPHTLHAGLPVKTGEKIIITKWFREVPQSCP